MPAISVSILLPDVFTFISSFSSFSGIFTLYSCVVALNSGFNVYPDIKMSLIPELDILVVLSSEVFVGSSSSSFSSGFSSGSSSAFLVTVKLYVFVVFLSSAVTFTSKLFLPIFNDFSPVPVTVAFESDAYAYIDIVSADFGTTTEYVVFPFLNPEKSYFVGVIPKFLRVASVDNLESSSVLSSVVLSSLSFLVIVKVYVFVVFLSCAVTLIANVFFPTFKLFEPVPVTVALESDAYAYIEIFATLFGTVTEYDVVAFLKPEKSFGVITIIIVVITIIIVVICTICYFYSYGF